VQGKNCGAAMSKTVTTNVRNDDAMGMIHLFEFDLYLLNGNFSETLRFTDHDVFVYDGSNEYTPLTITFDRLTEDFTMASDTINIAIDNVNEELTTAAMAKEFRNNRAKIIRVLITPPAETIAGNTYEFGISENASGAYPRLEIAGLTKDSYVLFEGVIDTFSASTQTFTAQLTTKFTYWQAPYPSRTYSQSEFVTIVDAISSNIFWGRQKTV
jgi:hypothetical protein|tara:strand:+ start:49 stop:687 length:639 start_codon:yes stop_codon:yes gene_type:complete